MVSESPVWKLGAKATTQVAAEEGAPRDAVSRHSGLVPRCDDWLPRWPERSPPHNRFPAELVHGGTARRDQARLQVTGSSGAYSQSAVQAGTLCKITSFVLPSPKRPASGHHWAA
jgi:hypothetical protein